MNEMNHMVAATMATELANPGSPLSRALRAAPSRNARLLFLELWKLGFCDGAIAQANRLTVLLTEKQS